MPASLEEFLHKAGLGNVFVPPALEADVQQVSAWVFGTRADARDLYDYAGYISEAATEEVDDYLLVGQAGHGIQSYALHYFLVDQQLALFVQMAWGGAYGDHDVERAAIAEQMALVPQLYDVVQESDLPPDTRLVVALSDFHGARWALLPAEMSRQEFLEFGEWQVDDGVEIRSVLDWLNSEDSF